MWDDEAFAEAIAAYQRWQRSSMTIYTQPGKAETTMDRVYVYLRNSNGEIARYNRKTTRIETGDAG